MVVASRPDLEVVGAFNPGVIRYGDDVILLVRVSEAPHKTSSSMAAAPFYNAETRRLEIRHWQADEKGPDVSDSRFVVDHGRTWLTSISHLRVARSSDGVHFEVDGLPTFGPENAYESFGIEDARITLLDGIYWINYTAVSDRGIATGLASTKDFKAFERHGIIFPPPNRDVTIFPQKINGRYVALHRPMPEGLGHPAIWIATSSDLLSWGDHRIVATARPGCWDDVKIGGGAVPFKVHAYGQDPWLAIYHGVTGAPPTYALGALLLDQHDPSKVIARSREPILQPETPYEREGFFGRVVFTCGALVDGDLVRIYYGAADGVTAVADLSLRGILTGLT
jgi:predicted GH43/DUF377 family glycosyl hydrolase